MDLAPFRSEADATARRHQRRFLLAHLVQLTLLVSAAGVAAVPPEWLAGLLTEEDVPQRVIGTVTAVLFGTTLIVRVVMAQFGDEAGWYAARRAAENTASLCYRYAFGAPELERSRPDDEVDRRFLDEFASLGTDILVEEQIDRHGDYSEITEDMRRTRRLGFAEAKERYFTERLEDQERWFSDRSRRHHGRSRRWLTLMLVAELSGLVCAILAASLPDSRFIGVVGLLSALAAAFLAWAQLRQHSMLAASYRSQAVALKGFGARLPLVTEGEWPEFVAAVEGSLTAEHTRWQSLIGYGR